MIAICTQIRHPRGSSWHSNARGMFSKSIFCDLKLKQYDVPNNNNNNKTTDKSKTVAGYFIAKYWHCPPLTMTIRTQWDVTISVSAPRKTRIRCEFPMVRKVAAATERTARAAAMPRAKRSAGALCGPWSIGHEPRSRPQLTSEL